MIFCRIDLYKKYSYLSVNLREKRLSFALVHFTPKYWKYTYLFHFQLRSIPRKVFMTLCNQFPIYFRFRKSRQEKKKSWNNPTSISGARMPR